MVALLFQGVSGVAGGVGLVADPTGGVVGVPLSWLQGSLFSSYFVPGLILLLGLGIFPLVAAYGLWRRRFWARWAALLVGVALIVWIVVEILVIGYHARPPFQVVYGALGLVISALALLPSIERSLEEPG